MFLRLVVSLLLLTSSLAGYEEVANDTYRKFDNTLTIQVYPSTYPLDWNSSRGLIISLIKNQYYFPKTTSVLGHLTAEVNCNIVGKNKRFFLGQSVDDLNGFRHYLLNGYGYSILNRPNIHNGPYLTVDGKLDVYSRSLKRFNESMERDHFSAISFKIGSSQCETIFNYMKSYKEKTLSTDSAGNRYGFGADPEAFEGAGCATFVEVLLKIAEVPNYKKLIQQSVYVPKKYLGDPLNGKYVSLISLLVNNKNTKIREDGDRLYLFPDPQVIYDNIQKWSNDSSKLPFKLLFHRRISKTVNFIGFDTTTK